MRGTTESRATSASTYLTTRGAACRTSTGRWDQSVTSRPTTLGNLYSAQLWDAVVVAIPDVDQQVQRGEFVALLGWLRDNVHAHGRRFPARELARRVTGHPLGSTSLLRYLDAKLRPLYGL